MISIGRSVRPFAGTRPVRTGKRHGAVVGLEQRRDVRRHGRRWQARQWVGGSFDVAPERCDLGARRQALEHQRHAGKITVGAVPDRQRGDERPSVPDRVAHRQRQPQRVLVVASRFNDLDRAGEHGLPFARHGQAHAPRSECCIEQLEATLDFLARRHDLQPRRCEHFAARSDELEQRAADQPGAEDPHRRAARSGDARRNHDSGRCVAGGAVASYEHRLCERPRTPEDHLVGARAERRSELVLTGERDRVGPRALPRTPRRSTYHRPPGPRTTVLPR